MEQISKAKRLILHFDINKTILMLDSAKFADDSAMVMIYILSAQAWGLYNKSDKTWKLGIRFLNFINFSIATETLFNEKPKVSDCELLVSAKHFYPYSNLMTQIWKTSSLTRSGYSMFTHTYSAKILRIM